MQLTNDVIQFIFKHAVGCRLDNGNEADNTEYNFTEVEHKDECLWNTCADVLGAVKVAVKNAKKVGKLHIVTKVHSFGAPNKVTTQVKRGEGMTFSVAKVSQFEKDTTVLATIDLAKYIGTDELPAAGDIGGLYTEVLNQLTTSAKARPGPETYTQLEKDRSENVKKALTEIEQIRKDYQEALNTKNEALQKSPGTIYGAYQSTDQGRLRAPAGPESGRFGQGARRSAAGAGESLYERYRRY